MLTQPYLYRLLHYDPLTGLFTWRISRPPNIYKGRRAGTAHANGYRSIGIDGVKYYEHRLAWFYVNGVWPKKGIDHINRDVGNNSIAELRLADQHQNLGNKGKNKNNTSGYKGVCWHKQRSKWVAQIQVHGKRIHLGLFITPQQAHAAYVAAAKLHFGAYARYA
jgi:hypothetical protein